MKYLILLLFSIIFHGDNMATYTMTKTQDKLHITARLDASDLAKAIGSREFNASNKDLLNYLLSHMSYSVNNQQTSFVVKTVKTNHHHVRIELVLNGTFETISDLKIKNELLFDVNDKQANVMEVRFDGMIRDFLIHKKKSILNINLD